MKISIVTVTWNSGATVEDTIQSVLKQTHKDYEYIIMDGLSKDNTLDIVRKYESEFQNKPEVSFKWISEKDKGIYDAMNKGLKMATGEVVGIINSDDFFTSEDVLKRVSNAFESGEGSGLDAIYGDIHFVKSDNLNKCTRYFSSRYFRPWALRFGFMPAHASFYCKKEVFQKYGYYDLQYRTSSDFEMMVRLFHNYKIKAMYVNMDFVTMRTGGASTVDLQAKKNVLNDIASSLKQHGIYSNKLLQCIRYAWRIGEMVWTKIKY